MIDPTYLLRETPTADDAQRTEWNVRDSDATVVFSIARELAGGSETTIQFARRSGKPFLHLSRSHQPASPGTVLREFLEHHRVRVLNVAGPRASEEPTIATYVGEVLSGALLRRPESS